MKKVIILILIVFLFSTTISFATSSLFTDVSKEKWYYPAIEFVSFKGYMIGYDNLFRPDDYITRSEVATIIQRMMESINDSEQQTIDTVLKVMPYCVSIYDKNSSGSGICISGNYILTANHVVKQDTNILINFYNNDSVYSNVKYRSEVYDLAILQMISPHFIFDKIKIADDIQLAESVIAIGNPVGYSHTVSKGIVSNVNRKINSISHIQFDAVVNHGNSGCPLFNSDGELLGVVVSKLFDGVEGISFAIGYEKINQFLEDTIYKTQ